MQPPEEFEKVYEQYGPEPCLRWLDALIQWDKKRAESHAEVRRLIEEAANAANKLWKEGK